MERYRNDIPPNLIRPPQPSAAFPALLNSSGRRGDDRHPGQLRPVFFQCGVVKQAGGSAYSESEYAAWLAEAGFAEVRKIDLPGPADLIVAVTPAS